MQTELPNWQTRTMGFMRKTLVGNSKQTAEVYKSKTLFPSTQTALCEMQLKQKELLNQESETTVTEINFLCTFQINQI